MKYPYWLAIAVASVFLSASSFAIEAYFEEDDAIPLVNLDLAVRSGAVTDPKDALGLTQFMGRMLLRGTQSRSKEQINQALDQIGGKVFVETTAETLVIRGVTLASHLEEFTAILREMLTQPSFPPLEIEKLRSEMISEILEDTADDRGLANLHYLRFLFGAHPYGNAPQGTQKSVQKINAAQIRTQYENLFQDRNFVLIGSGAASSGQIVKWAEQLSRARPSAVKTTSAPLPAPDLAKKTRMTFIDKPDRTQVQIRIGHKGDTYTSADHFALNLANTAFGGGVFNARLMQEIRVKRGWSYGAYSNFRLGSQPRSWTISMAVANKDAPAALEYTLKMLREFAQNGLTEAEFQFFRNNVVRSAGFNFNTPAKRAENRLVEAIFKLPENFTKTYGPRTESLTLPQVNEAIRKFFNPDQLAILALGTEKVSKAELVKAAGLTAADVPTVPFTQE